MSREERIAFIFITACAVVALGLVVREERRDLAATRWQCEVIFRGARTLADSAALLRSNNTSWCADYLAPEAR